MTVQEERLKTDCNVFIDRVIEMIKEDYRINRVQLSAGFNGIMSLLQYAKESHTASEINKERVEWLDEGLSPD